MASKPLGGARRRAGPRRGHDKFFIAARVDILSCSCLFLVLSSQPDDTLDRAEFVLLELLRMGRADITTIALIFK